jgi:hypothetical protein
MLFVLEGSLPSALRAPSFMLRRPVTKDLESRSPEVLDITDGPKLAAANIGRLTAKGANVVMKACDTVWAPKIPVDVSPEFGPRGSSRARVTPLGRRHGSVRAAESGCPMT